MIRFLANRYTRQEIIVLRKAIVTAHTTFTAHCSEFSGSCRECYYYRPCLDLSNFLKHLEQILAIPEGVQK